ncbi:MAG: hypothetical protein HKP61_03070 [Dactylosporangium sp.]|nr:hypothetical protein [Dactylosporangium sp.]NNJ59937.1 hypothetical protein [Dactylosporangium sp.]
MARLRHLVVMVPGIGGSVLKGHYGLAAAGLARTLAVPRRLDLDRNPHLEPDGLVRDFTVLPLLLTLPGYRRWYQHLRNAFDPLGITTYRPAEPIHPDTDVLLLPYDFRRSIVEAARRLDAAVDEALSLRGEVAAKPVIIVAHSMGGLVARYWIAVLGGWRRCQALITLGTPFRGAPKALDWLVNGVRVGPVVDARSTRVIRGWPSVYELLPQYEAVWDATTGSVTQWTRLPAPLVAAKPLLAGYAERYQTMAEAARGVHEAMWDGWAQLGPDQVPAVIPYLARGHATANLATFDGTALTVTKDDPPWRGSVGWAGDGTVPALGAIPHELGEAPDRWRVRPDRHGPLGSIGDPVQDLLSYAGDPVPVRGGSQPAQPWLGLDCDDFALAGTPVPVGVSVCRPEMVAGGSAEVAPGARASAMVIVTPQDGPPISRSYRLAAATTGIPGQWRGELDPLAAGRHEVSVEVHDPAVGVTMRTQTVIVAVGSPAGDDGDDSVDGDGEEAA